MSSSSIPVSAAPAPPADRHPGGALCALLRLQSAQPCRLPPSALPAAWHAHARAISALSLASGRAAPPAPPPPPPLPGLPLHAALHPAFGRAACLPGLADLAPECAWRRRAMPRHRGRGGGGESDDGGSDAESAYFENLVSGDSAWAAPPGFVDAAALERPAVSALARALELAPVAPLPAVIAALGLLPLNAAAARAAEQLPGLAAAYARVQGRHEEEEEEEAEDGGAAEYAALEVLVHATDATRLHVALCQLRWLLLASTGGDDATSTRAGDASAQPASALPPALAAWLAALHGDAATPASSPLLPAAGRAQWRTLLAGSSSSSSGRGCDLLPLLGRLLDVRALPPPTRLVVCELHLALALRVAPAAVPAALAAPAGGLAHLLAQAAAGLQASLAGPAVWSALLHAAAAPGGDAHARIDAATRAHAATASRRAAEAAAWLRFVATWAQLAAAAAATCCAAAASGRAVAPPHCACARVLPTEESLPWGTLAAALLAPFAGDGAAAAAATRDEALVDGSLAALAGLHRLFEVAVCALADTGGDAAGSTAPGDALAALRDAFGLVTPVSRALSEWLVGRAGGRGAAAEASASASARRALSSRIVAALAAPPPDSERRRRSSAAGRGSAAAASAASAAPAAAELLDQDFFAVEPCDAARRSAALHGDGDAGAEAALFPHGRWRGARLAGASLLCALLEYPASRRCLYASDVDILVDVLLRELGDLPVRDGARLAWLRLLRAVLLQSQWGGDDGHGGGGSSGDAAEARAVAAASSRYRAGDIIGMLTGLHGPVATTGLPDAVCAAAGQVLAIALGC